MTGTPGIPGTHRRLLVRDRWPQHREVHPPCLTSRSPLSPRALSCGRGDCSGVVRCRHRPLRFARFHGVAGVRDLVSMPLVQPGCLTFVSYLLAAARIRVASSPGITDEPARCGATAEKGCGSVDAGCYFGASITHGTTR
jgi:hypothetical protein